MTLRVALAGVGTVGGQVMTALLGGGYESHLVLSSVGVRDDQQRLQRGVPDDLAQPLDKHLIDPARHDVFVELLGGLEPARSLMLDALSQGLSVVTANKAVLAYHGEELERAARAHGASLRFEAAVGGGTPLLAPLAADLAANRIDRVRGIINGTTNYILSRMQTGASYDEALADAKRLGYAEADPSGDLAGDDAANKVVILARLAFGSWGARGTVTDRNPSLLGVASPGIVGLTGAYQTAASAFGLTLRLLAVAERHERGIQMRVTLSGVPVSPMARVDGVTNRVEIDGRPVGRVAFEGPGAGGAATSSAVLGDLLALADGRGSTWPGKDPPTRQWSVPWDWGDRRWLLAGTGRSANTGWAEYRDLDAVTAVLTPTCTVEQLRAQIPADWADDRNLMFIPVEVQ